MWKLNLSKKTLMEQVTSLTEGNYTFEVNIIMKTELSLGSDDQCLAVVVDVSINIQSLAGVCFMQVFP